MVKNKKTIFNIHNIAIITADSLEKVKEKKEFLQDKGELLILGTPTQLEHIMDTYGDITEEIILLAYKDYTKTIDTTVYLLSCLEDYEVFLYVIALGKGKEGDKC